MPMGPLEDLLGVSWGILGASWVPLGASWDLLGPLGASWGRLWPTRCSRARKAAQARAGTASDQRADLLYVVKDMISSSIYIYIYIYIYIHICYMQ